MEPHYVERYDISIHAPREGSDVLGNTGVGRYAKFLSTLPVRGATMRPGSSFWTRTDFYPRSP